MSTNGTVRTRYIAVDNLPVILNQARMRECIGLSVYTEKKYKNGIINTMISKEEIKKLADLARIEIDPEELEGLRGEIDSILDYVSQVKGAPTREAVGGPTQDVGLINVLREDEDSREPGTYTDALLREVPEVQDRYVKVKKVL